MNWNEISTCSRTKSTNCQCSKIGINEDGAQELKAQCVLSHSDTVKGTFLLRQTKNQPTLIVGKVTGLTPGLHGFHIHEFGDLSKGCESAGGHYNPDNVDHGNIYEGHVGDLGNITADDNGIAEISIIAPRVDLLGDRSVIGRSIVIHSGEDDLGQGNDEESLKTGNSGDRLACGVIVIKEPSVEEALGRSRFKRFKKKKKRWHLAHLHNKH